MGLLDITIKNLKKHARENPLAMLNIYLFPGLLALDIKKDYDIYCRERDEALIQEGFQNGYRQGNVDAAKKFAEFLEQSDNFRIGAFAVGYHVARRGDNLNAKLGVIVDALGAPDSPILSNYVRSENNKILCNKPEFAEICTKYLKSLNTEQLKSIDNFLREIINSGGASVNEVNFFNNLWKSYLKQRDIDTDSIF